MQFLLFRMDAMARQQQLEGAEADAHLLRQGCLASRMSAMLLFFPAHPTVLQQNVQQRHTPPAAGATAAALLLRQPQSQLTAALHHRTQSIWEECIAEKRTSSSWRHCGSASSPANTSRSPEKPSTGCPMKMCTAAPPASSASLDCSSASTLRRRGENIRQIPFGACAHYSASTAAGGACGGTLETLCDSGSGDELHCQ